MVYSKEIVREWLDEVAERAKDHPEGGCLERCYTDTLTIRLILEDGSTFVLTGDIKLLPCGFVTSTAQLRPYLHAAKRSSCVRPLQVWSSVR